MNLFSKSNLDRLFVYLFHHRAFNNYFIIINLLLHSLKNFFFLNHFPRFSRNQKFINFEIKESVNIFLNYYYKFCELNLRGLCYRNDEIIIEATNFYNRNSQVQLPGNLFSQFLSMIYAAEHFEYLAQFKWVLHFGEIIIIAIEFIFVS